ncbi:hypothetical protein [Celerinatantimonas sp. YJH-8]|uniref:hypothetical protein n=1 Tax=Celerinatantimonas sp. YJH-8 TaxID=3228714 RepID=UPI0038C72751
MFIVIWRGWGILVVPIVIIITLAVVSMMDMLPQGIAGHLHHFDITVAMILSAIAVWFVGCKLNNQPGRELIDRQTGQLVTLKTTHSLFFIPVQYWVIPLALFALISCIL